MRLMKISVIIIPIMLFIMIGCQNNSKNADNIYNAQLKDMITLEKTDISLSIDSISSMEEVKPDNPSGYYSYYNDIEGYYYYVIKGHILNPNQIDMKASYIESKAYSGNKEYETKFAIESVAKNTFIDTISVAEKTGFRIIVLVKDGQKEPDKIELYYNDELKEKIDNEKWNNCLILT